MNVTKKNTNKTVLLMAIMATLSACGGGGGGSAPASNSTGSTSSNNTGSVPSGPPALAAPNPNIPTTAVARTDSNTCTATQYTGGYADKGFSISGVYWLQVAGQDAINAPAQASDATVLASGKDTVIRVDVTGQYAYAMPTSATLTLGTPTGCKTYTLTTKGSTVPAAADKSTLAGSFTATIPAADITGTSSTMTFQVVADNNYASTQASADRLYKSGSVPVRAAVSEEIHMVPVSFQGQTGYSPSTADVAKLVTRTEPQASATVITDGAMTLTSLDPTKGAYFNGRYIYDYNTMSKALGEIEQYCFGINNNGMFPNTQSAKKCAAVFPDNVGFGDPTTGQVLYFGLGLTGGLSLIMKSFNTTGDATAIGYQLPYDAQVFVHEFGHVMTLLHAPCGNPSQVDSRLYAGGTLGPVGMGYDALNGAYFQDSTAARNYDLMGYCGYGGWTSDRAYRIVLDYKLNGASSTSSTSADVAPGVSARQAQAASQPRAVVFFRNANGTWNAMLSPMPAMAVPSKQLLDAGMIHGLLGGLSVTTLTSDAGESGTGPYFVPASTGLVKLLKTGIPGVSFKQ